MSKQKTQPHIICVFHTIFLCAIVSQEEQGKYVACVVILFNNQTDKQPCKFPWEGSSEFSAPLWCLPKHCQQNLSGPERIRT